MALWNVPMSGRGTTRRATLSRSSDCGVISAKNHDRPDAKPDQAPEPDAQQWSFDRDIECRVDDNGQGIEHHEQEEAAPLELAAPLRCLEGPEHRGKPGQKEREPQRQA